MQTPVSYGKTYFYSFDAAWVAGDTFDNLWVGIFEFDGNGNYITRDTAPGFLSVVSTNFTTYSYTWTPTAANCARMGFVFVPETTRPKAATLDLDNVVVTAVDTSNLASAFGDFQGVAPGTSVSQTTDATTVPGWLIANGNPGSDFFTATIIPATGRNAGAGTKALQFAITNNTDTACYLESQMPIPVSYGTKYLFSFDAAWVSGGTFDNLWVGIKEFDSSGNFIIRDQLLAGFLSVTSTNYATYRYTWTPTVANRANIHFIFYPEATRTDPATFSLANIRFETVNDSRKVRRAAAQ